MVAAAPSSSTEPGAVPASRNGSVGRAVEAPSTVQAGEHAGAVEAGGRSAGQEQHGEAAGEAGEEHGAEEAHGPGWGEYAFKWINFGLLIGLLWWLIVDSPAFVKEIFDFPGLRTFLAERRRTIVEERDLARERMQEADELLSSSEERLARVEEEVEELIQDARDDAERERRRAEEEGRRQAERIREMTERELRGETLAARRELRVHVADLAVRMAEEMLLDRLTDRDQQQLVRRHLERLEERVA